MFKKLKLYFKILKATKKIKEEFMSNEKGSFFKRITSRKFILTLLMNAINVAGAIKGVLSPEVAANVGIYVNIGYLFANILEGNPDITTFVKKIGVDNAEKK